MRVPGEVRLHELVVRRSLLHTVVTRRVETLSGSTELGGVFFIVQEINRRGKEN